MNLDEMKKKVKRRVSTGWGDAAVQGQCFDEVKIDATIKHEFIDDGKILLVHEVPITKVGVQQYDDGKHLKTFDAVKNIRSDYNPLVLYHPENRKLFREMNDEQFDKKMIGWTADGFFQDSSKARVANFYLIVDRLNESAPGRKLLADIQAGRATDVSVGFDVEILDEAGEYEGVRFDKQQVVIDLDHTAILPGAVGRFSNSQGVGIGSGGSKKDERGGSMGDEKDSKAALDAINADLGKTKTALDEQKKQNDSLRSELDALKKAEADRKSAERKNVIDGIMSRITPQGKEQDADFRKTLEGLGDEALLAMDKKLGDAVVLNDNRVHFRQGGQQGGSTTAGGRKLDKFTDSARKSFETRYLEANKLDEKHKGFAVQYI